MFSKLRRLLSRRSSSNSFGPKASGKSKQKAKMSVAGGGETAEHEKEEKTVDDAAAAAEDAEEATSSAGEDAEEEAKPKFIHLLLVEGTTTFETHFRVKTTSALERLKTTYAQNMNVKLEDCRFLYKGERITDLDTAESLNMQEGDIVEVYQPFFGLT